MANRHQTWPQRMGLAEGSLCRSLLMNVGFILMFSSLFRGSEASRNEAAALLEFFDGAKAAAEQGGSVACVDSTRNSAGRIEGCPSSFCGVTCGADGSVVALQLSGKGLTGTILPNTLSKLQKLSILDLSHNNLSGSLPDDLGTLGNLETLDLSYNSFSGAIPTTFGGLSNLLNLSLSANKLNGSIPSSFGDLRSLVSLNLSINFLQESIPLEMSAMESLKVLDMHHNQLSGALNPALLGLSSLTTADLSDNKLSGFLPWQPNDTLPLLRTLQFVNLSHNQFTGPLAASRFTAIFAEKLQVLDMSYNQLSGSLPDFEFSISLSTLRLSHNLFTGTVPATLLSTNLGLLQELDLSCNNLTGEITRIQSTSLTTLNVSHNSLSGMIPQKIGTCYILDLSNNNLSGNLSYLQYWTDMLEVLDLSHNRLNGQLMDEVPRFLRLRTLLLSNNELEGIIPSDYGSFPKLSYMDLSFNNLRGTIPASFFNTSSLFSLVLSNNLLEGEIPFPATHSVKSEYNNAYGSVNLPLQIGEGPQIAILDLSNNNLSGILSEGIGSLQKLAVLNLSHNEISGPIPIALCNLTELQDLDLSGNLLTGSIPDALPASLSVLALSGNNLSGTIPRNLKRFPEASFYPGNDGLTPGWASPDWKGPLNKSQKGAGRHGIIKAALIGGCVGALLFVIVIALFVFLRKSSMSDVHEKASNDSLADGQNHQKCAPCSGLFSVGIPARPTNMDAGTSSLNSILTDKITKPLQTEVNLDGRSQWVRKSIKDTSEGKSTDIPFAGQSKPNSIPESVLHHESLGMAGELHVDSPVVLKVQSPDRLAGELYFLDKSFIQCTAEDLSRAPAEVLGRSSHGTTYKATLDSGHVLTVKWLREGLARSKKEFTREAKKFSRIRHPNLNPLRGYYWGPQEHEKLILWDYVRSGSLAAHLADSRGLQYTPLSWQQRWIIATDVARGLVYLHNDRHLPHGNLKATNVLINGNGSDLSARLSDYSLHLLMTPEGTATQILNAGALGYRAPELAAKKRPTPTLKGDIYAYGVLILELLTGKGAGDIISGQSEAVDLTDWVKLQASERRFSECLDPIFSGESIPQGTEELVDLALRCISPLSSQRPNIGAIFEELSFLIASLLKVQ